MKFFKQVVLPIAVLIGLIGLVTFVSHYRGAAARKDRSPPPSSTSPVRGD
jgi:hypothetical protein